MSFTTVLKYGIVSQGAPSFPISGLTHYWSFDDTSGTTFYDSVTNTQGTLTNSDIINSNGKNQDCLDNTSDKNMYANTNIVGFIPKTINAWCKVINGERLFILNNRGSGGFQFALFGDQEDTILFTLFGVVNLNFSYTFNYETWEMYTIVDRSDTFKLYVNGNLIETKNNTSVGNSSNEDTIILAYTNYGSITNYKGIVDEIGTWDRDLTEQEISDLYNNGDGKFY